MKIKLKSGLRSRSRFYPTYGRDVGQIETRSQRHRIGCSRMDDVSPSQGVYTTQTGSSTQYSSTARPSSVLMLTPVTATRTHCIPALRVRWTSVVESDARDRRVAGSKDERAIGSSLNTIDPPDVLCRVTC